MRILIDIGHPAHVHYFKNSIKEFFKNGNLVIVVARAKEITFDLLKSYDIQFISRGKGKNSILGKFLYLFFGAYKIWKIAKKNKVDCYLSFASPYNALASIFYHKPNITFDDTEHNIFNHCIYVPFSDSILTPESFKKNFGRKHIRFKGTMDSAYLHPTYFISRDVSFPDATDIPKKKVILRIVSWNASHDINHYGFSHAEIHRLIEVLSQYSDIFLSSEGKLPSDLDRFLFKIEPEDMHYYMQKADLFIGESGSMATEAAYLGTDSIVFNSASNEFGVFNWFSKYKNFHIAENFEDVTYSSISLLKRDDLKSEGRNQALAMVKDGICLTDFIVWFVQNYPGSINFLKENPDQWSECKDSQAMDRGAL